MWFISLVTMGWVRWAEDGNGSMEGLGCKAIMGKDVIRANVSTNKDGISEYEVSRVGLALEVASSEVTVTVGVMLVCNGKIVGLGLKWLEWSNGGFGERDVDGNSASFKETCMYM